MSNFLVKTMWVLYGYGILLSVTGLLLLWTDTRTTLGAILALGGALGSLHCAGILIIHYRLRRKRTPQANADSTH